MAHRVGGLEDGWPRGQWHRGGWPRRWVAQWVGGPEVGGNNKFMRSITFSLL